MVRKISKYIFRGIGYITIQRIECSLNNIEKIVSIFNFKNVALISDLKKDIIVFEILKKHKLKYATSFSQDKDGYVETIIMIPILEFNRVLKELINYMPDTILIFNIIDSRKWEQYLFNQKLLENKKIIKNKLSDIVVFVETMENTIDILIDSEVYSILDVNEKIKKMEMA